MPLSMGEGTRLLQHQIRSSTNISGTVPSKHEPGQRAGMCGVFNNDSSVDQNGRAAAGRILMRLRIGRAIAKIGGIKDRYVGAITLPQEPAVLELERAGARARHLVHGKLERNEPEFADIMTDDAGK